MPWLIDRRPHLSAAFLDASLTRLAVPAPASIGRDATLGACRLRTIASRPASSECLTSNSRPHVVDAGLTRPGLVPGTYGLCALSLTRLRSALPTALVRHVRESPGAISQVCSIRNLRRHETPCFPQRRRKRPQWTTPKEFDMPYVFKQRSIFNGDHLKLRSKTIQTLLRLFS